MKNGSIRIGYSADEFHVKITIEDNGRGIPEEIVKQLGQRGFSFKKKSGSGLGLYHALTQINSLGGSLNISSSLGVGTKAEILLPRAAPPEWFCRSIDIRSVKQVLVLDDDDSIHQFWANRMNHKSVAIYHFHTTPDFLNWRNLNRPELNTLHLIDYELRDKKNNGLELIRREKLQLSSILVSSHYDSPKILDQCLAMKLQILPKTIAPYVPIIC